MSNSIPIASCSAERVSSKLVRIKKKKTNAEQAVQQQANLINIMVLCSKNDISDAINTNETN